jgi:DNA-binding PadR family transcriptional regulator
MTAAKVIRSQVNWTVLGLLLERPSYGYELHQRMARRIPAELLDPVPSHVYAALNVLERAGLIEPLSDADPDGVVGAAASGGGRQRQPKVHYRATAEGGRAFRAWLAEQMRSDPAHGEFVRRLALAAGTRRVDLMHDLVDAYEAGCVREAQALPMAGADGLPARSPDALVDRLTVAARRTTLEAHHAWLQYARKEIDAFERGEKAE